MVAGRKPVPTRLKVIAGNPGRRPLNTNEPQPEGALCDAPEWFDDEQRMAWDYAIDHAPDGLLTLLDKSALVAYVVAEDAHRKAAMALSKDGMVKEAPSGYPVQSPYVTILNRQAMIMLKAAAELGFTPSSRSRVSITPKGNAKKESGFAQFKRG